MEKDNTSRNPEQEVQESNLGHRSDDTPSNNEDEHRVTSPFAVEGSTLPVQMARQ